MGARSCALVRRHPARHLPHRAEITVLLIAAIVAGTGDPERTTTLWTILTGCAARDLAGARTHALPCWADHSPR